MRARHDKMQSPAMMYFFAWISPIRPIDRVQNADILHVPQRSTGLHFPASRRAYFVRREKSRSLAPSALRIFDVISACAPPGEGFACAADLHCSASRRAYFGRYIAITPRIFWAPPNRLFFRTVNPENR
jgi:hypothetical protein